MILLADSGTTKCDWIFIDKLQHDRHFEINTPGLNPTYHTENEILGIINNNNDFLSIKSHVEKIYFFGSGCGDDEVKDKMRRVLGKVFYKQTEIHVSSDIEGAVYACADQASVVAILGTGSNCCYFDENSIDVRVPSLGYVLTDDGGGSQIGREALRAYLYNRLSQDQAKLFEEKYSPDIKKIKHALYKESNVSQYLASYAPFALSNLDDPLLGMMVRKQIKNFFDNVLPYYGEELKTCKLHFVGSVAYLTRDVIAAFCGDAGYELGEIIQRPVIGMAERIDFIDKFYN